MLILTQMYITLIPAIMAGVLNMVWCSLPLGKKLNWPIDAGRNLPDGKRIFGENKTWKGFFGMPVLGALCFILWGLLCNAHPFLLSNSYLYESYANTVPYNAVMGLAAGLAYALCELPNSFLKRRLDIRPGKPAEAGWKLLFIFLDQADSVFGVVLVVALVYPMDIGFYLLYVLLGAATHIVMNLLLFLLRLRKNPF